MPFTEKLLLRTEILFYLQLHYETQRAQSFWLFKFFILRVFFFVFVRGKPEENRNKTSRKHKKKSFSKEEKKTFKLNFFRVIFIHFNSSHIFKMISRE